MCISVLETQIQRNIYVDACHSIIRNTNPWNVSIIKYTVKRLIIGDYLFGEIGEFFKFAKISCHQIETLQSLDITSVGNRQINSLPNCHIWKTAKYNSRQIFSFYSKHNDLWVQYMELQQRYYINSLLSNMK